MTFVLRPSDRRAFGRRESTIHAVARLGRRVLEPCVVRDFSDGGARLEFTMPVELPAKFRLIIEAKGFDAECEVRHHVGASVGVRFVREDAGRSLDVAAPDAAPVPDRRSEANEAKPSEGWRKVTVVSGAEMRRLHLGGG